MLKNSMDKLFQPVIKWSGSKRSQARDIVANFPKHIDIYYEPFCGGASVLRALLETDVTVNKYVCSDLNKDLINLWNTIKNDYKSVSEHYCQLWHMMNDYDTDKAFKRRFFESVRERYNKERNPLDFMFIMRTTTNGMPRYNRNGDFNNSFHITRDGITPDKLDKILREWSSLLNKHDVIFKCSSYSDIKPSEKDFMYLDPPYANTKGMYFGGFDNKLFFEWLSEVKCPYALSYDGISGNKDNTFDVPDNIFDKHLYIRSGNSSFKRVIGKDNNAIVYESLYLKH